MDKDKIEAFVSRGKKLTDTDWILVPAAISLGVSIFNIYYSDFHIVTIVFGCLSNMLSFLIYFLVKEKAKKKKQKKDAIKLRPELIHLACCKIPYKMPLPLQDSSV